MQLYRTQQNQIETVLYLKTVQNQEYEFDQQIKSYTYNTCRLSFNIFKKYLTPFFSIKKFLLLLNNNKQLSQKEFMSESNGKYMKITYQQREQLISLYSQGNISIRQAAKKMGLKDSTARAILNKYFKDNKIFQKRKERERKQMILRIRSEVQQQNNRRQRQNTNQNEVNMSPKNYFLVPQGYIPFENALPEPYFIFYWNTLKML